MTVTELIAALQEMPPDLPVKYIDCDYGPEDVSPPELASDGDERFVRL